MMEKSVVIKTPLLHMSSSSVFPPYSRTIMAIILPDGMASIRIKITKEHGIPLEWAQRNGTKNWDDQKFDSTKNIKFYMPEDLFPRHLRNGYANDDHGKRNHGIADIIKRRSRLPAGCLDGIQKSVWQNSRDRPH